MVYFRTLPAPLNELDSDVLELFFNFANTYTEESILSGYVKHAMEKEKEVSSDVLKDLGYTDEDLLSMNTE